ncbi:hypothetical protein BGW36DRAFT_398018 [Talaromyces proteolyticus]|uniref:BTB domain-containing protein n=1 Tax=Talaromyces proteolyticus TaxID=1131652 RepID=A0AAD4PZZ1_9EURO|nr:uncharacterized protein BGW36DRAFT_398018 [Talaromyces proteolyticus]KAH8696471.1 hypothetical protein BGW36DRAFT_398018 [Talaromyces proteolyticus]
MQSTISSVNSAAELLNSLFLNPEYSNLTITCGAEVLPVHRNVVYPKSAYFAHACAGNFKEASRNIKLKDRKPILVKKVLQFLYIDDYTLEIETAGRYHKDGEKQINSEKSQEIHQGNFEVTTACHFHILIYIQADYLQIDSLKVASKKKFHASFHNMSNRRSFKATIKEIYRSTPKSDNQIRNALVASTKDHLATLQRRTNNILLDELLKRFPDFTTDLCITLLNTDGGHQKQVNQKASLFSPIK